jgi:GT2 family glycosyltransferase/glycosyltransferase involved in cell wall biosynthesis
LPAAFPASLRVVLYGAGADPAQWRACLPQVPASAWRLVAADDPLAALREAARAEPGVDLLLLHAGTLLPPFALERLLRCAAGAAADVVSPLGNRNPGLSPLAEGEVLDDFDPDAVDRGVALFAPRRIAATRDWLADCSLWRRRALDVLLAREDWPGGALPDAIAGAVCDHLFVARAPFVLCGPPAPADPRHPAGAHPLDLLRARLRAVAGAAPARPGLDGRPVVLHVMHGWGGGVERWVRDLARADDAHCHLALVAHGNTGRGCHGERLTLESPAIGDCGALREWPLAAPIAATVAMSAEYRAILAEVVRDFAVDAVVVSSLIGHSLDALGSGLPTVVACHDRYPAWPLLHDRFDDPTRRFDEADLRRALATARDSPFAERDPRAWLDLREAWLAALNAERATLVFPGEALRASLLQIEPRLSGLAWRIVPHGLAPFAAPIQQWTAPPRARPRVLVLGRVNGAKGAQLLSQVLPRATGSMDFHLLGCGKAGEAFLGVSGVHLELDYARDDLPALVARIKPDFALLPSTVAETFSYTLSELWALGVPPLACAIGSFAERIDHGRSGWLVACDADAVLAGLSTLAGDQALRARLREGIAALPARDSAGMAADHARLLGLAPHTGPRAQATPAEPALLAASQATLAAQRMHSDLVGARRRLGAQQRELERRAEWALGQQELAAERTRWAQALQADLQDQRKHAATIEAQLEATAAALRTLQGELAERTAWAQRLDAELEQMRASSSWRLTRPLRAAARFVRALRVSAAFQARQFAGLAARTLRSLRQRGVAGTWRRSREWLGRGAVSTALVVPDVPQLDQPFAPFAVPAADSPAVSIVIPVYNHFRHTLTCLRSLAAHPGSVAFEVIVVDDASSDESPQRLAEIGGIRVFRNPQNLGFIGACNAGAALARGDYVLFLNNDTAITEGWLEALLGTFAQRADCGLVGAKLVYPDGRLQEAGGIVFSDGSGWNYGRFGDPRDCAHDYLREADYCSGAAIMLRRELFERLGGFDAHYAPAYYEDTDLAFKVRAAGLKVYYQPAATVVHFEGVSSGTDTASGTKRFQVINQAKFVERWKDALAHQPAPGTPIALAREHRVRGRLLIVDACVPTPDQDSGSVRMVNLMKVLIDLGWKVSFMAENRLALPGYSEPLQRLGVEMLHAPWAADAPGWLREHGHMLDAVVLSRHYVASAFLPLVREHARRARVVFDTVDLHYLREQRAAELEGSAALAARARATREAELRLVRDCDVTVVVSPVERELLMREAPGARVEVLSNVHEVAGLRAPFAAREGLWFVGGFQHPPNVDAVLWFLEAVWPRVEAALPDVRFHVVGSRMPDDLRALADARVEVHGFVEDLDRFLDGCRLSIAPLRYGAGVKGKVNMAMAHGQPVVATPMAVEGMHVVAGDDVLVADDAAAFADAIVRAYTDEALWSRLSANGLANVARHFSFDAAREALGRILPPRA